MRTSSRDSVGFRAIAFLRSLMAAGYCRATYARTPLRKDVHAAGSACSEPPPNKNRNNAAPTSTGVVENRWRERTMNIDSNARARRDTIGAHHQKEKQCDDATKERGDPLVHARTHRFLGARGEPRSHSTAPQLSVQLQFPGRAQPGDGGRIHRQRRA